MQAAFGHGRGIKKAACTPLPKSAGCFLLHEAAGV